jgi:hypothetical protein
MTLDFGLRDGRIGLTKVARIEAVILETKIMDLNYFQVSLDMARVARTFPALGGV